MLLVTCANGNQGKLLLPKLLASGHDIRAVVNSESSANVLRSLGVKDALVGDLADPAFVSRAMKGIDEVYYVSPTLHPSERSMGFSVVDAARAEGVKHFIFSSVLHAITTDLIQHEIKRDIEEHLLSSHLEFTILQPSNYMLPFRMKPPFEEGVFRLSWDLNRYQSMVDLQDVTDVVLILLADLEHHRAATYELVGPGRFNAHEIAEVISKVMGRKIPAEKTDVEAFVRSRFGGGDPQMLEHHLRMSGAIMKRYSAHDFLGNPNVLTWLLGRQPTTFEQFVEREYAGFRTAAKA